MLNKATLIGYLGKDPLPRLLKDNDLTVSFSLATSEKFKDKVSGEKKESTEWHNIEAFGNVAQVCLDMLKKGSHVYIEGKIITSKFKNKDGVEVSLTKIRANIVKILDKKGDFPTQNESKDAEEYDIPF